jgi:hypothetical protein
MERVGTLINKLKEQFEQQADAGKLAVTAQLLLSELQKTHSRPPVQGKISIVLPAVSHGILPGQDEPEAHSYPSEKEETVPNWLFDTAQEAPTLVHHAQQEAFSPVAERKEQTQRAEVFEFNTVLASQAESLNEKLKEEKTEVATALQAAPIRDLKKAIGVNDRFLFVNDLFRGDENMYERSLKTINNFSIYAEAQYWIQRELKVKLSWPDNSDSVNLFDQLIKRRFS